MATRDLVQTIGDAIPFSFTFKDENGDAVNLTGALLSFTIKENLSDADAAAVYAKDVTSHDDAVNGLTSFVVPAAETALLSGEYYYDIQIVWANGRPATILKGVMEFTYEVTKRTSAL